MTTTLFILKMFFHSLRRKNARWRFFTLQGTHKLHYYGDVIHSFHWKSAIEQDDGV